MIPNLPNELGDGVCSDKKVIEAYALDPLVEKEISTGLINQIYEGVQWLKANIKNFSRSGFDSSWSG